MNYQKILKPVAVIIFLLGLVAFVISYRNPSAQTIGSGKAMPSFTATYSQTFTPSGSERPWVQSRIERWQKSDGSWKEITTDYDKEGVTIGTYTKYAVNGRGLFRIAENDKQLRFLSARPDVIPAFSQESFRKSPNFSGESAVVGYKTLIERITQEDGSTTEFHHAPELNGLVMKIISTSEAGITVIEATEIQIRTISDSEYGVMPDYPVVYDSYKNASDSTRANGNPDAAKEMEKNIPK